MLFAPCISRPLSVMRPGLKFSADLPSNNTSAPSGGFAASVGLLRTVRSMTDSCPSSEKVSLPPVIDLPVVPPVKVTVSPSRAPSYWRFSAAPS